MKNLENLSKKIEKKTKYLIESENKPFSDTSLKIKVKK